MMKNPILAAMIVLAFAGCTTMTPAVQEYTLVSESSTAETDMPLSAKKVAVMPIKAPPSLSLRNITYVQPDGETGPYLYARWNDAPANLIGRQLLLTLEEKNIFTSLMPSSSAAKPDWFLESDLHSFHHRFLTRTQSRGVLDITLRVVDAGDRHIIAAKRFTITAEAKTPDSKGAVDALSRSVGEFDDQSSRWLETLAKEYR